MRFIIGAIGGLAISAALFSTSAFAQDCNQYTAGAIAQTQEYQSRGCTGGLPEWWSLDAGHHRNWCVSLPAGSSEPAQGMASREAVLQQCRAAYRPPQVLPPPVQPPALVQRPTVFQGTVCDNWEVRLFQGAASFFGVWRRGDGFYYNATWRGEDSVINRIVYPLNANLSFWSEDPNANLFFFYYNEQNPNFQDGQIGGGWEAETTSGAIVDNGTWRALCVDLLHN